MDEIRESRLKRFCKQEAGTQTDNHACSGDGDGVGNAADSCRGYEEKTKENLSRPKIVNYCINIDISNINDLETLERMLPKFKIDSKGSNAIPKDNVSSHNEDQQDMVNNLSDKFSSAMKPPKKNSFGGHSYRSEQVDDEDNVPDYSSFLDPPNKKSSLGGQSKRLDLLDDDYLPDYSSFLDPPNKKSSLGGQSKRLDLLDDDYLPDYSSFLNPPNKKSSLGGNSKRLDLLNDKDNLPSCSSSFNLNKKSSRGTCTQTKTNDDLPSITTLYEARRSSSGKGFNEQLSPKTSAVARFSSILSDSEEDDPVQEKCKVSDKSITQTKNRLGCIIEGGLALKSASRAGTLDGASAVKRRKQQCPLCNEREANGRLPCGHTYCTRCLALSLVDAGGSDAICPFPCCDQVFEGWMTIM